MREGKRQSEEEEVENKAGSGKYRNHIMKDTQKQVGEAKLEGGIKEKVGGFRNKLG